jgi:hypothetical protein
LAFGGCGDLPIYQRGYPISIGGVVWIIVLDHKTELNWRGIKTLRDSCGAGLRGHSFLDSLLQLFRELADIDRNFAKTHILTQDGEAPFGFTFRKENGTWAIDLTSIMNITETAIEKQVERLGISENDFIVAMLRKISGSRPDSAIWQPIQ